jgi:hypothetical protein
MTLPLHDIRPIDAGGGDTNQHFPRGRHGIRAFDGP